MKPSPTVADLPADVRDAFSGDAREVYRAAHHISYACDGRDAFLTAFNANGAATEARTMSEKDAAKGLLITAVFVLVARWIVGGTSAPPRLIAFYNGFLAAFIIPCVTSMTDGYSASGKRKSGVGARPIYSMQMATRRCRTQYRPRRREAQRRVMTGGSNQFARQTVSP